MANHYSSSRRRALAGRGRYFGFSGINIQAECKALLGLIIVGANTAVLAHHSTAAYDLNRDEAIEGVVEEYHWANPHSWIKVLTQGETGASRVWSLEFGSPSISIRTGWTPTTLKPGDRATFVFKPRKDGEMSGVLAVMILPDGTQLRGMVAPSGPLPASSPTK